MARPMRQPLERLSRYPEAPAACPATQTLANRRPSPAEEMKPRIVWGGLVMEATNASAFPSEVRTAPSAPTSSWPCLCRRLRLRAPVLACACAHSRVYIYVCACAYAFYARSCIDASAQSGHCLRGKIPLTSCDAIRHQPESRRSREKPGPAAVAPCGHPEDECSADSASSDGFGGMCDIPQHIGCFYGPRS